MTFNERPRGYKYYPKDDKLFIFDKESLDQIFNQKFNKIRELFIRAPDLTEIPNLSVLKELKKLIIYYTKIGKISGLENMKKLEILDLATNKIVNLTGLENLTSLRSVSLHNNQISNLNMFKPLTSLSNLQEITLSNNNITDINITCNIPKLASLNLSRNKISRITAVKNLLELKTLNLNLNKLSKLENLSNLPNLQEISAYNNPIQSISGIKSLPKIESLKLSLENKHSTFEAFDEQYQSFWRCIIEYAESIGFSYIWNDGGGIYNDGFSYDLSMNKLNIYRYLPKTIFKINDYLTLKLTYSEEEDRYATIIFTGGEEFLQCKFLLMTIPVDKISTFSEIKSIDEAAEKLDGSLEPGTEHEPVKLTLEGIFWGHCSNLQVWTEHNYDTRLLHRNIAFPLLKKLTELGDPIAKRVFKEEIAKRYASGYPSVVEYLRVEGYLDYLTDDEMATLN